MGQAAKKLTLPKCPECGAQMWELSGPVTRVLTVEEGEVVLWDEYSTELERINCNECYFDVTTGSLGFELDQYWFSM